MTRTGNYFDVTLNDAHLNWGTIGASRITGQRNSFESYIPISMHNARTYNIMQGEIFTCTSEDGYFQGLLKAAGSQGTLGQYGKNFTKSGDMRAIGYWLKDRKNAQPGDTVRIFFNDENTIEMSLMKN